MVLRRGALWYWFATLLFIPGPAGEAAAQSSDPPSAPALRFSESLSNTITLDGLLNEPVWRRPPAASDFRQYEPDEGAPATEKTEVRVIFDAQTLYVGVMAYDRQPEKIISRILQRDRVLTANRFIGTPSFGGDDAVALLFDPFHDHRNAMIFATNPNGAEFDALLTDEGREFNIDWRAVWRVAAKRTPEGWSAEFAIPFRTLRYPAGAENRPWGFNVDRMIRRKNEEVLWSAWSRDIGGLHRVSHAGHLQGMTDLPRPGLNLEIKPFALSSGSQEFDVRTRSRASFDAGVDAKWEVRPGLSLDATLNTDFAQVEVDDEQVNLTRFELFFPEKRDFFLENAGIFEFGLRSGFEPPPFLLFFSRRIGIHDDGQVPVIGGTRLTGRAGAQTVGLLDVVTDRAFGEPRTNFAVARVKRDIGGSNYLGAMFTDRRSSQDANTGAGLDGTFWLTSSMNLQGFAARTFTRGLGADNAYRLALDETRKYYGFTVQHMMVGSKVEARTGFVSRTDIRRSDVFFRVSPRPPVLGLRRIDIFNGVQYVSTVAGRKQDWNYGPFLSFEWHTGDALSLFTNLGEVRIDEEFDLADSVNVPSGDYDFRFFGASANTSSNRTLSLALNASYTENFGGIFRTAGGVATLAAGSKFKLSLGYTRNRVNLPGGAFDADISSLRLGYAFSTRLFSNLFLQYNQLDKDLSWNFRLNFIHRPGSDIFLVLNEQRGSSASLWDEQNREMVFKITYLSRL